MLGEKQNKAILKWIESPIRRPEVPSDTNQSQIQHANTDTGTLKDSNTVMSPQ